MQKSNQIAKNMLQNIKITLTPSLPKLPKNINQTLSLPDGHPTVARQSPDGRPTVNRNVALM